MKEIYHVIIISVSVNAFDAFNTTTVKLHFVPLKKKDFSDLVDADSFSNEEIRTLENVQENEEPRIINDSIHSFVRKNK